jgi:tripartite-type tricarboxylate transporter receptor subunit TctC
LTRNIKSKLSSVMIQIVAQFFNRRAAYIGGYNITREALLFLLTGFYTVQAIGQSFPVQPVRILVGFPPGGGVDIVARAVGQKLSEVWGQPVIIENRPGANAIIATELLVKATPNGYTLQLSSPGALVISPNMGTRLSYDPLRDITPVTVVSESAALLVVNPSVPVNSVKELISFAKAKPGELTYGSSGTGGPNHMAGELLKQLAGIDLTHIPYKGSAPATTDLLGGQVKLMFGVIPALLPFVNSGKLKALGVGSAKRSLVLPNTPTIAESGVPGYALSIWYGIVAPKNTPAPIVNTLNSTLVKILRSTDMQNTLMKGGSEPVGNSPEQFAEFIKEEYSKYNRLIKAAGITSAQ